MKLFKAAVIGLGLLTLGGCAVYEPYPVYQSGPAYPAYPPAVVVQPRVYGYWGGYWDGGHRHGGHGHHGRGWGHGHGHGGGRWR